MNILIFVIEIVIIGLIIYYQRKVKNWADIDTARDLNYEAEKGKNLATKDDIADITRLFW